MHKNRWLTALYKYYTVPLEEVFPRFKLGLVIFFLGLVTIYAGYQLFEPSIQQEIITLLGLFLIGFGFLLAMLAQTRILIGRILRFFKK